MGVSTNCGLMVGLPYEEFEKALQDSGEGSEGLDEAIDSGELDCGSTYYDSPREENIVGKWLFGSTECKEIIEADEEAFLETAQELERQFPTILFKLYMTLDVS